MVREPVETCDVAIVGGGPAGLSLAQRLREMGVGEVTVLERDHVAGGVPRHCGHYPFGMAEFGLPMKGPRYAARKVDEALATGVNIRSGVTVTELGPDGALSLSSDAGTQILRAQRVALCTGAREASRAQRFISGPRPKGIISTGALQAFVYLEKLAPFRRPVILGTELVSFSALLTCRHARIRPVAMVEENTRVTARSFSRGLPALLNIPVHLGARVRRIIGEKQVEAVEIETANGEIRVLEADGVICTGMFRPESALLRNAHLEVDPASGGPVIDQYARASDPTYFCAGNLLRPVEAHEWCAKEGRSLADVICRDVAQPTPKEGPAAPIRVAHSAIRFSVPGVLSAPHGTPALSHVQLRLSRPARGRLLVRADGREIWSKRINALPERRLLVPLAPLVASIGVSAFEISLEEEGS